MVVSARDVRRAAPAALAVALIATLAPAGPAPSAQPADGPSAGMIEFQAAGETVRAWLALPERDPGRAPAVVVIHEWWGLNDQIKGVADRFARAGFAAIAPDLFRGRVAADRGLAHELSRGLSDTRAVALIEGAIAHMRSAPGAGGRRVGTIGFCMGGGLSLKTALRGANVQATALFYGSVETTEAAVAPLRAPVLGIFGADDRGIPVEEVRAFEAALKARGKNATILVYAGVGHAFFNEENPSYDRGSASDAWARARDFFTLHLRPGSGPKGPQARPAPDGTPSPVGPGGGR